MHGMSGGTYLLGIVQRHLLGTNQFKIFLMGKFAHLFAESATSAACLFYGYTALFAMPT